MSGVVFLVIKLERLRRVWRECRRVESVERKAEIRRGEKWLGESGDSKARGIRRVFYS